MNKPNLTDRQKKMVLTSFLMATLGFNLSAPLMADTTGAIELASTARPPAAPPTTTAPPAARAADDAADDEAADADRAVTTTTAPPARTTGARPLQVKTVRVDNGSGARDVRIQYASINGGIVTFVPYSLEGGTCPDGDICMSRRVLNIPFTDDATKLGAALTASYRTAPAARPEATTVAATIPPAAPREDSDEEERADDETREEAPAAKTREEIEDERRDAREEADQKALDRIAERCGRYEDKPERQAKCLSDDLAKLLKDRSRRSSTKIDEGMADRFFNENVLPAIQAVADKSEDGFGYERAGTMIRDIQAKMPRGYDSIRKSTNNAALGVVNTYVTQLRASKNNAQMVRMNMQNVQTQVTQLQQQAQQMQQSNPAMAQSYMQMAMQMQGSLMNMQTQAFQADQEANQQQMVLSQTILPSLTNSSNAGLMVAIQNQLIDQNTATNLQMQLQMSGLQLITNSNITVPGITNGTPTPGIQTPGTTLPGTVTIRTDAQYNRGAGLPVIPFGSTRPSQLQ